MQPFYHVDKKLLNLLKYDKEEIISRTDLENFKGYQLFVCS